MTTRILGTLVLVFLSTGCGDNSTGSPESGPSPSTLSASVTGENEITLSWTRCDDTAFSDYTLYRSQVAGIQDDQSEAAVLAILDDEDATEFVDSDGCAPGWIHYAVKTTDAYSNTVWSNEEQIYISPVPNVDGLVIGPDSHGRNVALHWNPVSDADGYMVYFRASAEEQWAEILDTAEAYCIDSDAQSAGYYTVKAYQGEDASHWYSPEVSTMPVIVEEAYTIYDNYCPGNEPDGFIFSEDGGQAGNTWDPGFTQEMYAYDNIGSSWDVSLYSGNYGPSGNGCQCFFQEVQFSGYCEENGTWIGTEHSMQFCEMLFLKLPRSGTESAYVKLYNISIMPYSTETGTLICFRYEYQPETPGLTLFTATN